MPLFNDSGALKRNLIEDIDFTFVPAALYDKFVAVYGGGPAVQRKVSCLCYSSVSCAHFISYGASGRAVLGEQIRMRH